MLRGCFPWFSGKAGFDRKAWLSSGIPFKVDLKIARQIYDDQSEWMLNTWYVFDSLFFLLSFTNKSPFSWRSTSPVHLPVLPKKSSEHKKELLSSLRRIYMMPKNTIRSGLTSACSTGLDHIHVFSQQYPNYCRYKISGIERKRYKGSSYIDKLKGYMFCNTYYVRAVGATIHDTYCILSCYCNWQLNHRGNVSVHLITRMKSVIWSECYICNISLLDGKERREKEELRNVSIRTKLSLVQLKHNPENFLFVSLT